MLSSAILSAPAGVRIAPHVRFVTHGQDGGVLLDIERGRCFSMNRLGAEIWNILDTNGMCDLSGSGIAEPLSRSYGLPVEEVRRDVSAFLHQLTQKGFLIPTDNVGAAENNTLAGSRPISVGDFGDDPAPPVALHCAQEAGSTQNPSRLASLRLSCLGVAFLIWADVILKAGGFRALHGKVKNFSLRTLKNNSYRDVRTICTAVDRATRWYLKPAWCLQRSAVTTCILRLNGIDARLAIGCRKLPFKAHAWVEVNGVVVNDRPDIKTFFTTMDRL